MWIYFFFALWEFIFIWSKISDILTHRIRWAYYSDFTCHRLDVRLSNFGFLAGVKTNANIKHNDKANSNAVKANDSRIILAYRNMIWNYFRNVEKKKIDAKLSGGQKGKKFSRIFHILLAIVFVKYIHFDLGFTITWKRCVKFKIYHIFHHFILYTFMCVYLYDFWLNSQSKMSLPKHSIWRIFFMIVLFARIHQKNSIFFNFVQNV